MKLYHVTTQKKAKLYRETGHINRPVRGFTTLQGAMAWAIKVNRTVIYEITHSMPDVFHKLPDHHNKFGEVRWIDADVNIFECVLSADNDA